MAMARARMCVGTRSICDEITASRKDGRDHYDEVSELGMIYYSSEINVGRDCE